MTDNQEWVLKFYGFMAIVGIATCSAVTVGGILYVISRLGWAP